MAVSSLKYRADKAVEESSRGVIVYDGRPAEFFDWEFRTSLKYEILKTESDAGKRVKIINQVIDGLRGDALQTAQDLGIDELIKNDGLDKLIKEIKEMVFPQKNLEAKELYDAGHLKTGILCRQRGESMLSFISLSMRIISL